MKKVVKFCKWIFIPVIIFFLFNFTTSTDPRIEKILNQLEFFRTNYSQQKINLHIDKDSYMAGEEIWIKSYLVNAFSFMPDSVSKEIYVELIDWNNKPVQRIILRNKKGFSTGSLLINDTLSDGNYQLRAYTNWMRNFDNDFYYYKTIKINNPDFENVVTSRRINDFKKFNKKYEEMVTGYQVTFFPEGGDLVSGFQSKVAFKAENKLGNGIDITGSLYSENGEKIIDFQSTRLGMGFFSFVPKFGVRYYASVFFNNSKKDLKFELPEVLENGISMTADPHSPQYIRVNIRSNRPISANIAENEIILAGQARGNVLYVSKGELKDKSIEVLIRKELFPAGIVQLTVFDSKLEPACERLVFVNSDKEINANTLNVAKQVNGNNSKYSLKLTQKDGTPAIGNLSISVCEAAPDGNLSHKTNILTQLLLTSDLKGRIENPSYYFTEAKGTKENLDLVMLTHGWRRFVWNDVLNDKFPKIQHQPSLGITIEGKLTRELLKNPIANGSVKLTVLSSYNDIYQVSTDSKGKFIFANLDYDNLVDVKIEALSSSGGKGGYLRIADSIPKIDGFTDVELQHIVYPEDKIKANNKRERIAYRAINKNKPVDSENKVTRLHDSPDEVVNVGEEASNYADILQYMQGRVPGVNINGNRVIIRGNKTFISNSDPLFLLDGIAIDISALSYIEPGSIATIEVLKGANAAVYGSRSANGVIAFYSRKLDFIKKGVMDFEMKGYHKVKEFYVPAYDSWKYKPQEIKVPRTLFWAPEVITNKNGEAVIEFENSFRNENTFVTIEGITKSGELIYYQDSVK
jgi:hypothetical protein